MNQLEINSSVREEILAVDDKRENLQLLIEILESANYKVRPVTSGKLALRSIKAKTPSLILLDIKLPEMDGFEICRQLKTDEKTKYIPIIFISALEDEQSKLKGFQAGAADFISKPFHAIEVLARVKTHLALYNNLKLAVEQHRLAEELFANAFQTSPDSLTITRLDDGVYVDMNDGFTELTGYSREDVLGKSSLRITMWPNPQKRKAFVEELAASKRIKNFETVLLRKDKRPITVLISATIISLNGSDHLFSITRDITERKQAELFLRESELKYSVLFGKAGIPAALTKLPGNAFADVNEAFENLFGYSKVEVLGKTSVELGIIPPESQEHTLEDIEKYGALGEHEKVVYTKTGKALTVSLNLNQVELGGQNYVITTVHDISEQKRAEEAIKLSEKRLRSTLDIMLEGCQIIGFDWRYLYLNDPADAQNRRPKTELLGKRYMDMWPGIETTEVFAKIKECLEIRKSQRLINEFTFPDGNRGWFDLSIQPIPEGVVILSYDITERMQSEIEVTQLNTLLHQLISSVKDLSSAHDLPTIEQITFSSAKKLANSSGVTVVFFDDGNCRFGVDDAISPSWKGKKAPLDSCLSGWVIRNHTSAIVQDISCDKRIQLDNYNTSLIKSIAMIPVMIVEPIAVIAAYWSTPYSPSDIEVQLLQTLADAAARAMENVRLYEELEQRVLQRTQQLEATNRELESFSYSVSHDLRAPLRSIDGFSQALLEDYYEKLDDEGKSYLNRVRSAAQRMALLIDDMLQLARVSRTTMRFTPVDLSAMTESIITELKHSFPDRVVDVIITPDLTEWADSSLMKSVMQNLLENAWKFTSKRPIAKIIFGVEEIENERAYFVRDNGAGFNMQYVGKLFSPFQRLHHPTDFTGTGIGLATVQRIIHRHNGRAWADGEVEKGATFYFTLNPKKEL